MMSALKNFLLFGLLVPLAFLGGIEGICRVIDLPRLLSPNPSKLEMPTWMLEEDNTAVREIRAEDQMTLAWLRLFETADGFRVRLKPGVEDRVLNTFSLIPDRSLAMYTVKANELGFRGPALSPAKPAGVYRILIFGDSSSYGWGVEYEQSYSGRLAALLEARNPGTRFEVGNFAMPGDSSEYGRLIFEKFAAAYRPDLIILGFGANDAKRTYRSHTDQVAKFRDQTSLQKVRRIASLSAIFRSLEGASQRAALASATVTSAPPPTQNAVSKKRYRENLRSMISAGKSWGAETLIVRLCTPGDYGKSARKVARMQKASYVNGQQILLDTVRQYRQQQAALPAEAALIQQRFPQLAERTPAILVSSDGCHPNALGHELVAEAIAEEISTPKEEREPPGKPPRQGLPR